MISLYSLVRELQHFLNTSFSKPNELDKIYTNLSELLVQRIITEFANNGHRYYVIEANRS